MIMTVILRIWRSICACDGQSAHMKVNLPIWHAYMTTKEGQSAHMTCAYDMRIWRQKKVNLRTLRHKTVNLRTYNRWPSICIRQPRHVQNSPSFVCAPTCKAVGAGWGGSPGWAARSAGRSSCSGRPASGEGPGSRTGTGPSPENEAMVDIKSQLRFFYLRW